MGALGAPQPLDAAHPLDAFDCGNPALNVWLVRHARQAHASGSAGTYVLVDDQRIAGYFSLAVGQIDSLDAPDRVRKGMANYPIPVVILARLAVSKVDQGRGLGAGLLQDAIRRTLVVADQAGVRALLTPPDRQSRRALLPAVRFRGVSGTRAAVDLAAEGCAPPARASPQAIRMTDF